MLWPGGGAEPGGIGGGGNTALLLQGCPAPKGVSAPQWGCRLRVPVGPGAGVGGNRSPSCWVPAPSPEVPGEALGDGGWWCSWLAWVGTAVLGWGRGGLAWGGECGRWAGCVHGILGSLPAPRGLFRGLSEPPVPRRSPQLRGQPWGCSPCWEALMPLSCETPPGLESGVRGSTPCCPGCPQTHTVAPWGTGAS